MRKDKVGFCFPGKLCCVEGPQLGWPSTTVTKSPRKTGDTGKTQNRDPCWGIQVSWCGSEWAHSKLVFLERQGLSDGDYSSIGCVRRNTHPDPWLSAAETQADPEKLYLRKAPAIRAKDAPWGAHSVPKGDRSPWGTAAIGYTDQDRDNPKGPWPWETVSGQEYPWRTLAKEGPVTCENRGMWSLG